MQHVLRCWERQSDGSQYKKTFRRPRLRPGPRWGSLQRSRKPPSWWGGAGCPLLKNPFPRSRPFGPRLFYAHSKISSDAHECFDTVGWVSEVYRAYEKSHTINSPMFFGEFQWQGPGRTHSDLRNKHELNVDYSVLRWIFFIVNRYKISQRQPTKQSSSLPHSLLLLNFTP